MYKNWNIIEIQVVHHGIIAAEHDHLLALLYMHLCLSLNYTSDAQYYP